MSAAEARALFPRGLRQPPGSYRFGLDALLLACMFRAPAGSLATDLGTGCGAAGLGMLLRNPGLTVAGFEAQPELCRAARHNARLLGLGASFAVVRADLARAPLAGACFDFALANPPFRQKEQGRLPKDRLRRAALFEEEGTLAAFCGAAALALKPGGRLGAVFPAAREADLLAALATAGLAPARLVPVAPEQGRPPGRLLVEALRPVAGAALPHPVRERTLFLHTKQAGRSRVSDEALAFCPFLACNAGQCP